VLVTRSHYLCYFFQLIFFGALALAIFALFYLIDDNDAVSLINSNEINHKGRSNYNYCESNLCPSNKKHIGCINKGDFGHKCTSDARVVKMDDYTKRLILHQHNQHRSNIAEGKTPGFPQAVRMGPLKWDDELAYLAELNAMSCEIEHDKVRDSYFHYFNLNQTFYFV
jgi:hypothetical protein